jgi:hypothetical protein
MSTSSSTIFYFYLKSAIVGLSDNSMPNTAEEYEIAFSIFFNNNVKLLVFP